MCDRDRAMNRGSDGSYELYCPTSNGRRSSYASSLEGVSSYGLSYNLRR